MIGLGSGLAPNRQQDNDDKVPWCTYISQSLKCAEMLFKGMGNTMCSCQVLVGWPLIWFVDIHICPITVFAWRRCGCIQWLWIFSIQFMWVFCFLIFPPRKISRWAGGFQARPLESTWKRLTFGVWCNHYLRDHCQYSSPCCYLLDINWST